MPGRALLGALSGLRVGLLALLIGLLPALPAAARNDAAQTVTLISPDGRIRVTGRLLSQDGETWRLETPFGELVISTPGITCEGHGCPDLGQYAVDLTLLAAPDLAAGLLPALIADYARFAGLTLERGEAAEGGGTTLFLSTRDRSPVARIALAPAGRAAALTALGEGTADLALLRRGAGLPPIRTTRPLDTLTIARDALVFLVAPDNPVRALGPGQLAGLLSGRIADWAAIGGDDAPVGLFMSARGIGAETALAMLAAAGGTAGGGGDGAPREPGILPDPEALARAVARDPFSLAPAGIAATAGPARALALRGPCGIRQLPDAFSVAAGDYPLALDVVAVTPRRRLSMFLKGFLAYLKGARAAQVVHGAGLVPARPAIRATAPVAPLPLTRQQERLANAIRLADGTDVTLGDLQDDVRLLADARRLPVTIRFKGGSTAPDAAGLRAIRALALAAETGEFTGRSLILVGFSDDQGDAEANRILSLKRARAVARALRKAAPRADFSSFALRVEGLGEAMPVACNDTPAGRSLNRRVELWVE